MVQVKRVLVQRKRVQQEVPPKKQADVTTCSFFRRHATIHTTTTPSLTAPTTITITITITITATVPTERLAEMKADPDMVAERLGAVAITGKKKGSEKPVKLSPAITDVPLNVVSGTHYPNEQTLALLQEVGGVKGILKFTTAFYKMAFQVTHRERERVREIEKERARVIHVLHTQHLDRKKER